MAKLTIRGHEVLDQTPVEVPVRIQKPLSVLDHQRIAMARARMEEEMQIRTDEELARDLFDFTPPPEMDGLPFFTAYTVADEVPDMYNAAPASPEVSEVSQGVPSGDSSGLEKSEVNQPLS